MNVSLWMKWGVGGQGSFQKGQLPLKKNECSSAISPRKGSVSTTCCTKFTMNPTSITCDCEWALIQAIKMLTANLIKVFNLMWLVVNFVSSRLFDDGLFEESVE